MQMEGQQTSRVHALPRRLDHSGSTDAGRSAGRPPTAHRRSLCVMVAARLRSSVLRSCDWCTWMLLCSLRLLALDPPLPPPLPLAAAAAARRQLNISYPATGCQKVVDIEDENKLSVAQNEQNEQRQREANSDPWHRLANGDRMRQRGRNAGRRRLGTPIPIPHPHQPLHARGSHRPLSARSRRSTMQLAGAAGLRRTDRGCEAPQPHVSLPADPCARSIARLFRLFPAAAGCTLPIVHPHHARLYCDRPVP